MLQQLLNNMNLEVNRKFRIKLESFDSSLLNTACEQIQKTLETNETKVVGPIYLPTKKRIYCVLRSTHVNKDAREHFEIRIHKRILDIYPTTWNPIQSIKNLNLPAGVNAVVQ